MSKPQYTFETFSVSGTNQFACAAANAVAQVPGKAYNPLFVWGDARSGKTHLLHAIRHEALKKNKRMKVVFLSCESFTKEYLDAVQNNEIRKFREMYLQVDLLLIDDVEYLADKERIQEEFFHLFNLMVAAKKQIVMTCGLPSKELNGLEARLVSRFEWWLVVDLGVVDASGRIAIPCKKSKRLKTNN